MPRPGPRRTFVGVRLGPSELEPLQELADAEHEGNLSKTIRTLIEEALTARRASSEEQLAALDRTARPARR